MTFNTLALPPQPQSVKIGPFNYKIIWLDRSQEETTQHFGYSNHNDQSITVCSTRKRQKVASTFLHEVKHAIRHVFGAEANKRGMISDEDSIASDTYGFCAFIRDNPTAMQWCIHLLTVCPEDIFVLDGKET